MIGWGGNAIQHRSNCGGCYDGLQGDSNAMRKAMEVVIMAELGKEVMQFNVEATVLVVAKPHRKTAAQ